MMAQRDPVAQFAEALAERGIVVPQQIIGDGGWQRADVDAPGGKGDASYVLHLDGIPAGAICNWRDGLGYQAWRADVGRELSEGERRELAAKAERDRAAREAEIEARRKWAKERALEIWNSAEPASEGHAYLAAKGVKAFGLRVLRQELEIAGLECNGALVVPLHNSDREISGLQFITPGGKRYLGSTAGLYYSVGKLQGDAPLLIAEGVATAHSLHECTGLPVSAAMDAGNLERVARLMRARLPSGELIVCADDDWKTRTSSGAPWNPGVEKARSAAVLVGARLAVPAFTQRPPEATDFNDMHRLEGAEAVRKAVLAAPQIQAQIQASVSVERNATGGITAAREWPEDLDGAAFTGLAGDIARAIAPHTEADEAAVLLQVLIAFGALAGRNCHVLVEADRHFPQLFGLIVGDSAVARKGTSWGRVREIFEPIPGWPRVVDGLSSGEGLKYAVRDALEKTSKDGLPEVVDEGVRDKRLLVVEPEFAQVLRQCARAGNTLSSTIRSAWDSGRLGTLTKNDPVTATGAHIAIIGHITAEELRAELTQTDTANGFANRFVVQCARRSKMLPRGGGRLDPDTLASFRRRIEAAVERASRLEEVARSESYWRAWDEVYANLSTPPGGLSGCVLARGAAQCTRLALIYALMDEAGEVQDRHLMAALALWERADASVRWIFGNALGDRIADQVLTAAKAAGGKLTRTEITRHFNNHESADRIAAALSLLASKGLMRRADAPPTGGRPTETWEVV